MKKIIEYLSSYFRSETEVITKKLNSMVIDYNKLKNSNIVLNSVEPNIITSIENMEKLLKLDDKIIASFAKKGWMGIFDAHLKSIGNFEKILKAN